MGGGGEVELRGKKDTVDVFFVDAAGFAVALDGFENRKHHGAIEFNTVASFIPLGVGSVDGDKSRNGKSLGGMCICIM